MYIDTSHARPAKAPGAGVEMDEELANDSFRTGAKYGIPTAALAKTDGATNRADLQSGSA